MCHLCACGHIRVACTLLIVSDLQIIAVHGLAPFQCETHNARYGLGLHSVDTSQTLCDLWPTSPHQSRVDAPNTRVPAAQRERLAAALCTLVGHAAAATVVDAKAPVSLPRPHGRLQRRTARRQRLEASESQRTERRTRL